MKHTVVGAAEFKAKCLTLLDELEESGGQITITKRGRPVATVQRVKKGSWRSSAGILAGTVSLPDDIESFDTTSLWDALKKD